ncbi:phosphotransferase enzyme family protein [Kribbella sp. CA-294648]|uniref:phosphotransferase enzyme family protein n=1 Tax=Kribbella sp. CA-294648 TaxID=3239948 RepID=UPI003D921C24
MTELTQVHHGADAAAEVWNADDRYAVKWSGGGTTAGVETTAFLAAAGVRGVPAPVQTISSGLWSEHQGKRLSLAPWIAGARAAETGLSTEQWASYGALLAEVHSQEPPQHLQDLLPPINPVSHRMPALTRELNHRLTTQAPADDLEAELAETWQSHRETIATLLERSAIAPTPGKRVICHADPHLGNVLVAPDQLYLIDWDDAVLAPVEQDLLFMLGGMGALGPTTQADQDAFFTGYGPAKLDPDRLTYYRCARALEDVALWAHQALTGPDRKDCLEILQGVLSPDGLAVRALA